MANKKYKIEVNGIEIASTDANKLTDFVRILSIAALYERSRGHLALHEQHMNEWVICNKQLEEIWSKIK